MAEKDGGKKQGGVRRDKQGRDTPLNAAKKSLREGKRLFNLNRWDMALQELLKVETADLGPEESTELAYFIGLSYTKLGRYEDSLLYLEQVITGSKDFLRIAQCRMTLAYIYVITNRAKLAEFELGQLLKNGYESVQIYTTLAYASWAQKRNRQAVDYYEKALEIDQNNTTALNGLGFILADANIDLIRAVRLCRRAVEMKPQNPAYLDSLGWAYFQYGDIAEARAWMRKAAELSPQNEDIRVHLKIVNRKEL
ncbi:MAG: tetratricopeptide repeat protein [Treponema sp.]|jgi:tetratricopeptide (TPR) repeat protein|nr:tetratricopeptide repeat protein [Treponema sp.]